MTNRDAEIEYYRQVEDYFAGLRGVPHVLSPKDFELLRRWWREEVPLAAVLSGIAETFERKRERGDADPVVSLTYCRHAVARHAKALAEAHAGRHADGPPPEAAPPPTEAVEAIIGTLQERAREIAHRSAAVAGILDEAAGRLRAAAGEARTEAEVADLLAAVETWLLEAVRTALPEPDAAEIERSAEALAHRSGARGEAFERTVRAAIDREIRRRFRLPRLELE